MIKIKAKREGFRRAGVAHLRSGKTYPDDFFSFDQLEQLKAEPMLEVSYLPDLKDPDPDDAAQAREILEKMSNKHLKADCDDMGIEYPPTATKAVPMLEVSYLPDLKDPDPGDAAQSREILEKRTNKQLKADCDEMGIEYPSTATKAVLVDLILKNTAPVPEE